MRTAAILIALAACSSTATPTAHPQDEVAPSAPRDAAPDVATVVPDAAPSSRCFDVAWIEGVDDGALAVCRSFPDPDDGGASGAPRSC